MAEGGGLQEVIWRGPRGALNAPGTLFPGLTPWRLSCSVLFWVSVTKSSMTTVSHGASSILSSREPLPPDPEDSIPHVFLGLSFQAQAPHFLQLWPKKESSESSYIHAFGNHNQPLISKPAR